MRLRSWKVAAAAAVAAVVVSSSLAGCTESEDPGGASGRGGSAGISTGGTGGAGGTGGSAQACVPSGGGAAADGGSAIPPTFETVRLVLRGGGAIMACATAPCHATGSMAPPVNPLTLQNDDQLYTHMTSYVSRACGNMKLVNPGKPNESALIKILTGPCGDTPRMPLGCSTDACIPDQYVAALSQWIANCAPEHE